jgi:hypothetical protein
MMANYLYQVPRCCSASACPGRPWRRAGRTAESAPAGRPLHPNGARKSTLDQRAGRLPAALGAFGGGWGTPAGARNRRAAPIAPPGLAGLCLYLSIF